MCVCECVCSRARAKPRQSIKALIVSCIDCSCVESFVRGVCAWINPLLFSCDASFNHLSFYVPTVDEKRKASSPGKTKMSFLDKLLEDSFEQVGDILKSEAQVRSVSPYCSHFDAATELLRLSCVDHRIHDRGWRERPHYSAIQLPIITYLLIVLCLLSMCTIVYARVVLDGLEAWRDDPIEQWRLCCRLQRRKPRARPAKRCYTNSLVA